MNVSDDGTIYIGKGEVLPFVCPQCEAIVPYSKVEIVTCWACAYSGPCEEFSDIEWELNREQ